MARAAALLACFAGTLRLEPDHVELTARRLREADLFIRETKSPRSWNLSARDAARLLIALLSDVPAVSAPMYVRQAERTSIDRKNIRKQREGGDWLPALNGIDREDCSFVDAIEQLIMFAVSHFHEFKRLWTNTTVEYERLRNDGTIYFHGGGRFHEYSIDFTVHFEGDMSNYPEDYDLTRRSSCAARTIAAIAEVLRDA